MSVSQHKPHTMPTLTLGFNDLTVLRSVILGYLAYARRALPPMPQRGEHIRLLQAVYQRLIGIPLGMTEVHLVLQEPEIHVLNDAMLVFSAFVRQKVVPSTERDETLHSLEHLRLTLMQILSTSRYE